MSRHLVQADRLQGTNHSVAPLLNSKYSPDEQRRNLKLYFALLIPSLLLVVLIVILAKFG